MIWLREKKKFHRCAVNTHTRLKSLRHWFPQPVWVSPLRPSGWGCLVISEVPSCVDSKTMWWPGAAAPSAGLRCAGGPGRLHPPPTQPSPQDPAGADSWVFCLRKGVVGLGNTKKNKEMLPVPVPVPGLPLGLLEGSAQRPLPRHAFPLRLLAGGDRAVWLSFATPSY